MANMVLLRLLTGAAAQGMWRTPHPSPDIGNSTKGLSGAVAIAMAYLTDGTVVFAERPHPLADGITNNPLIVNVSPSLLSACFRRPEELQIMSIATR